MQKSGGGGAVAAATGCFKCGRPGHWSRDCPSSSSTSTDPNPRSNFPAKSPPQPPSRKATAGGKQAPRTRPKLTPDLLLSDGGLGYVLRHFPRAFKYHGRGHEVSDLGNLMGMYAEWHSRLLPYYSFNQFVQKVEQVGATRRVKRCISELRERVSRGGDPTKLHEPPVEEVAPDCEPDSFPCGTESIHVVDAVDKDNDPPVECHDADDLQEEMLDEVYQKATEEPCHTSEQDVVQTSQSKVTSEGNPVFSSMEGQPTQVAGSTESECSKIQMTEEQRARMEANHLKALERASARARSSQAL